MFQTTPYSGDKQKDYELLLKQLEALIEDETDHIAILANTSALLNQFFNNINWVGFYIWKEDKLVLGPFQGLPACVTINYGKGVCGTAVKERKTQRIANVHEFPGHIACDPASKSEIVIPIIVDGYIYGVLDIDSPVTNYFDLIDQQYLEDLIKLLEQALSL